MGLDILEISANELPKGSVNCPKEEGKPWVEAGLVLRAITGKQSTVST